MNSYIVRGGTPLRGEVTISGSKNAALGVIAAAMVLDVPSRIENIPQVADAEIQLEICESIGAIVHRESPGTVTIDPRPIRTSHIETDKVRNIRASYYLLGVMLGKFGEGSIKMPGGCDLGTRPIDQHIKGFEALGATVTIEHGMIRLSSAQKLHGEHLFLDQGSVGATINIMLAAVRIEGTTIIENAGKEPHIVDVANFLNTMGANIRGAGTDVIRITGTPVLHGDGMYSIIPDQIEAGTFMIAAVLTRGDITVRNIIPHHMEPLSVKLVEMGAHTESGDDWMRVWTDDNAELSAAHFKTMRYPGFPTDLQPQTTVLLATATGTSRMHEDVFDNRFQYVDDLKMMGARVLVADRFAIIEGPCPLTGAHIRAHDLRAGAAMVLAGLYARGETRIDDSQIVERGYEDFIKKLTALGADIREVE
ncbi:MAG: UDP-N-acetylglucosamine 1-carboxyvinyltransferase [Clostridiaceae bacterium]|nr:UDP-N-acetylglucosamine 1-carboxyvinyltransferase [Clostridiaceae bacterium]